MDGYDVEFWTLGKVVLLLLLAVSDKMSSQLPVTVSPALSATGPAAALIQTGFSALGRCRVSVKYKTLDTLQYPQYWISLGSDSARHVRDA